MTFISAGSSICSHSSKGAQKEWLSRWPGLDGKSPNFQYPFLSLEAETEAYRGHARAAQEFARRAAADAVQAGDSGSGCFLSSLKAAWRETVFGDVSGARKEAASALNLAPQSEDVESWGAEVLARTGNAARAQDLGTEIW